MDVSKLTHDFTKGSLSRKNLKPSAIEQFNIWLEKALTTKKIIEPTAMSLATASQGDEITIRTVLLKYFDDNGFVFFTNYKSKKAMQIAENPQAALLFQWLILERQVKISGKVEKISKTDSIKYFLSRSKNSQIGAWCSNQSKIISNREILLMKFNEIKERYKNKKLPLPDFWGGYRVIPKHIEFWQGRKHRLHDRFLYTKLDEGWQIDRLAP